MTDTQGRTVAESVIDDVVSSQPELGPKVPDGGYGYVVFAATLFFQMFIPSLIVVYGIIIASVKINEEIGEKDVLYLWDEKLTHVPLFHFIGSILFDPTARNLISRSSWPRVVGEAGNCLTCAGLLFVWMGTAESVDAGRQIFFFVFAGLLTGIGTSIQTAQCEILLAQYFKTKHLYLTHISHIFVALGFILSPILISQLRIRFSLLHVILIYQSILLQGLLANLVFIKPEYLKSKLVRYHYVTEENAEDEEDIFSKSLTELRIKTKNVLKTIKIKTESIDSTNERNNWEQFEEEEEYPQRTGWEKFEEDIEDTNNERTGWEKFKETNNEERHTESGINQRSSNGPVPLFNDMSVNLNTTYAFDDENIEYGPTSVPTVFADSQNLTGFDITKYRNVLKSPTFYKSLLTIVTTKYSIFSFYVLFPCYLYVRIDELIFKKSALIVGGLSVGTLFFSGFSYWLNVTKRKRPIILFLLCWIGANGYFLISVYSNNEFMLIFGALEIVLSIASLQHIGGPLLGLTIRGESNAEYFVLSKLTGLSFFVFLVIDIPYKHCFLLMALLHIITGLLWVSNYFYKKLGLYNTM